MPRSGTVEAVLTVAGDIARRRHHPVVRAAHLIAALFVAPGMDRRIRRRGLDADHLRAAVDRALDDAPSVAGYRDVGAPTLCPSIEVALARSAHTVDAYGAAEIVTALEGAAELRGAFRPYVLDESLGESLDVADDADAEIVFLDDPITSFHLVVAILTEQLGPDEGSGHDLAVKIGVEGEVVVSVRPGREAKEMRRRAIVWARREGFPLRVVVRARAY